MLAQFSRRPRVPASWLFVAMLLTAPAVGADPKDDVATAGQKWAAIFADDNPDSILALYADDAVLWGTLSSTRLVGKQELRGYFQMAFKALPRHKVVFGNQHIRVYGDIAINTGYYTFSYVKDGEVRTLPARYSFVYRNHGGSWLIVDHHSSEMPAPPR